MSPTLDFAKQAEGQVPEQASGAAAVVMGKSADPMEIAGRIGKATIDGNASPVTWMMATEIVTPSGGLEAKGHETSKYKYRGGDMFGVEVPNAK